MPDKTNYEMQVGSLIRYIRSYRLVMVNCIDFGRYYFCDPVYYGDVATILSIQTSEGNTFIFHVLTTKGIKGFFPSESKQLRDWEQIA